MAGAGKRLFPMQWPREDRAVKADFGGPTEFRLLDVPHGIPFCALYSESVGSHLLMGDSFG